MGMRSSVAASVAYQPCAATNRTWHSTYFHLRSWFRAHFSFDCQSSAYSRLNIRLVQDRKLSDADLFQVISWAEQANTDFMQPRSSGSATCERACPLRRTRHLQQRERWAAPVVHRLPSGVLCWVQCELLFAGLRLSGVRDNH